MNLTLMYIFTITYYHVIFGKIYCFVMDIIFLYFIYSLPKHLTIPGRMERLNRIQELSTGVVNADPATRGPILRRPSEVHFHTAFKLPRTTCAGNKLQDP